MKKECANTLCQEPVYAANLCRRCYQRTHYWLKKSPKEVMERRQKLLLWSETVEHLLPKVEPIHLRKRRKRA